MKLRLVPVAVPAIIGMPAAALARLDPIDVFVVFSLFVCAGGARPRFLRVSLQRRSKRPDPYEITTDGR